MGTSHGSPTAVHLSPPRAQPAGGSGTAKHQGPGGRIAVEDRTRRGDGADLPASAAGQAPETAGFSAGCDAGCGQRSGEDRPRVVNEVS